MDTKEKFLALENYLNTLLEEDVAIAFSGGVDSTLLLHMCIDAAKKNGTHVYAYTVHSDMHPLADIGHAKRYAMDAGVIHTVLTVDELNEAGIRNNPTDRCYRCKYALFRKIKDSAARFGIRNIIERIGTGAFVRVKIGVGKDRGNVVGHVLGKFDPETRKVIDVVIGKAADAVEAVLRDGPEMAMNAYNAFNAASVPEG